MKAKLLNINNAGKKGDISIQVLVWAALGLIILIVLIALLVGKVKFFSENTPDKCPIGKCQSSKDVCPEGTISLIASNCGKEEVCCRSIA